MSDLLKNYSRQPKIYLRLPSEGRFYSQNPTEKSGSGELPVLSMTAKDELMMRTPDALMNGESIYACIKSCIPMIDDPWEIPLIDLDAVLVAIRIATYGEKMKMSVRVPGVEDDEELDVEIDLVNILDSFRGKLWQPIVEFNDLKLHTAPLKFQDQNLYEQQNFETNQFIAMMRDNTKPLEARKEEMKKVFDAISETNIELVTNQVKAIEMPDGNIEYNNLAIKEFLNGLPVQDFETIRLALKERRELFELPQQTVVVPAAMQEKGAPEKFEIPMVFNQSSFFALK